MRDIISKQARVNIPALGERTLRREICSSSYTTDSKIQVIMCRRVLLCKLIVHVNLFIQVAFLDEAVRLLPDAVWWIKADGVDVTAGLGESVKKEWSGDVDLNDGKVKQMHDAYLSRLKAIRCIGLGRRMEHSRLQEDLTRLESGLIDDLHFLSSGTFIYSVADIIIIMRQLFMCILHFRTKSVCI